MIPGTCPDCGAIRPLPDFAREVDTRAALAAALECPAPLARRILPYLALHAPRERAIQARRLVGLLRELADLLAAGTVTRRGDTRPAPAELWGAALDLVLSAAAAGSLTLPLDGHGYLAECAHRLATKAARPAPETSPLHASHLPYTPAGPEPDPAPVAPPRPPAGPRRAAPVVLADLLRPPVKPKP